jgi:CheY-like chemotaxis protein
VLIVDDEAVHRAVLRELLGPLGFVVRECDSAAQCLATTAEERFDLVLLDVNLPDRRGWEVCDAMHERPGPAPAIVMVSGNVGENTDSRRGRHRYAGFVAKPVMRDDLLATVGTALDLRWVRRPAPSRPAGPVPGPEARDPAPDADTLRELLALSAGKYPNALRARLEEIAAETPARAQWVSRMTACLEQDREQFHARLLDAIRSPAA